MISFGDLRQMSDLFTVHKMIISTLDSKLSNYNLGHLLDITADGE